MSTTIGWIVILWLVVWVCAETRLVASEQPSAMTMEDKEGIFGRSHAPVSQVVTLTDEQRRAQTEGRLGLKEVRHGAVEGEFIPVQFEPTANGARTGRLWWLMPAGSPGRRAFVLTETSTAAPPAMEARQDAVSGQLDIRDSGRAVLRYNYRTVEPGDVLDKVAPANRIYARPRSDYIHPLYGPDGEELTKDWPLDHPHHRGIYWAWPEVDYHNERGDLHALQRVFARPTGRFVLQSGAVYAEIQAENLWHWEDREPIVREWSILRAYRSTPRGRCVDLTFHFTALGDDVALARRGTDKYGGLNLRLSAITDQQIVHHTDPPNANPQMAWSDQLDVIKGGKGVVGLAVLQKRTNPCYPGDWIQFPELNWSQPTFPTANTRYVLKKGQTLTLQFRLWIHTGKASAEACADQWRAYDATVPPVLQNAP